MLMISINLCIFDNWMFPKFYTCNTVLLCIYFFGGDEGYLGVFMCVWVFLFAVTGIFVYTVMGGGKGKKNVNAKRTTNFWKYTEIRNRKA